MEESELILNDLFGDRRPPPGPLTESPCQTDHHETTPILASELDICESLTLGQFLAPPTVDGVPPPVAGESGVDEAWQVRDLLPSVSATPRKVDRYHQKATLAELARMLAPVVARLSLSKWSGTINVREAWAAVPEPKPQYDVHNSVGDALGNGRGGHALQLRRGSRRAILVCRENVNACLRRMTSTEVRNLAEQLGYETRDELMAAFDRLPSADAPADS